jgi:WSC domain
MMNEVLLIIHRAPTTTTAAATTTVPTGPLATFGDWVEIGCYTEATLTRALTLGTKVNYEIMEWSVCADFCVTLNAKYFGVEYGGEVHLHLLTVLSKLIHAVLLR